MLSNEVKVFVELDRKFYDPEKLEDALQRCKAHMITSPRARDFFGEDCVGFDIEIKDIVLDVEKGQYATAFVFVNFEVGPESTIKVADFEWNENGRGWIEGLLEGFISQAIIFDALVETEEDQPIDTVH